MKKTSHNKEDLKVRGVWRFTLTNVLTGEKEIYIHHNLVPTVARQMIANNLIDPTPDNTMRINKVALGTGVSVPDNSDTQLQTEVYRNDVASETNSSNIAYVSGFFSATETTGTYKEAGLYSDGTDTANTGILVSRVAINISKTNVQTLTIDWTVTIS